MSLVEIFIGFLVLYFVTDIISAIKSFCRK